MGTNVLTWQEIIASGVSREWVPESACKGMDTSLFFPSLNFSMPHPDAETACSTCSVRLPCLGYALHVRDDEGYFGGTTPDERRVILNEITGEARLPKLHPPKAPTVTDPDYVDPLADSSVEHGTYAGYTLGCRLPCCKAAKAAYGRLQRARQGLTTSA